MNKFFLTICALLATAVGYAEEVLMERIEKPQIVVMGIECRTSNDPEVGPQQIGQHWQKFIQEGISNHIPNKTNDEVIALYCDYEGDYTSPYSFVIGCMVNSSDEVPEGMVVKTLPATTYAVFPVIGEYPKNLIETWGMIWQSNLKRTYSGDFEVYGEKFQQSEAKQVDVFIAIE